MKKQFLFTVMLLSSMLLLSSTCFAQGKTKTPESQIPIVVKFNLLQMSDAQMERLEGKESLPEGLGGKDIASLELLTLTGEPSLLHLGEKWPIVYYDPRAEQFQVQYVDTGLKLDITVKSNENGTFRMSVRPETSFLNSVRGSSEDGSYPLTDVYTLQTKKERLVWDEAIVLGSRRGPYFKAWLERLGLAGLSPNLVYTLRLERP